MRFVVAGSLAAVAVAMSLGAAPGRVAFVTMRRVLAETPGYAQAETTFVKEMAGHRAEYQKLQVSLDSAATDFEQQATLLSATARASRRRARETRQQALASTEPLSPDERRARAGLLSRQITLR